MNMVEGTLQKYIFPYRIIEFYRVFEICEIYKTNLVSNK
jgi:hypothetical protein